MDINSYGEYIKYLNNKINWIYEEILAISAEKSFFLNTSWEDIAGFRYNPIWGNFQNDNYCDNDIKNFIGIFLFLFMN